MWRCYPIVLGGALLLAGMNATAAMRCGTELIGEGDSVVKLLEHCGDPTLGDPALTLGAAEWTYNFGPDSFMVQVLVRDGRVEHIEDLGRGLPDPVFEERFGSVD